MTALSKKKLFLLALSTVLPVSISISLVSCNNTTNNQNIPSKYNIEINWNNRDKSLKNLYVENGMVFTSSLKKELIATVPEFKLSNVTIPSSVEKITGYQNTTPPSNSTEDYTPKLTGAFENNNSIETINFEGENIKTIGMNAFANCFNLLEVNLSKSINLLDDYSFFRCGKLQKINLENVEIIGKHAFEDAFLYPINNNNNQQIEIKLTNLYALGDYAFRVSNKLSKVSLNIVNFEGNVNLRYIGDYAFESSKISNVIDFSNCIFLKQINKYAFRDSKIKSIKLNDNIEFIDEGAFSESSIESIDLSNTKIQIISEKLFWQCNKLADVKLNNSIIEFASKSFQGCLSLNNLQLPINLEKIGEYAFAAEINYLGDVLIPAASIKSLDFSKTKVKEINERTFQGCDNLQKIKLSSSFEQFDDYVFNKCRGLVEVDLSETKISRISTGLFADCVKLETVLLPNALINTIDANAFLRCEKLKTVATKMDLNNQSQKLQNKIIIPNTVTVIQNNAFKDSGVINIDMSLTQLTELPYNVLSNCQNLQTVKLPSSLQNIKNSSFNNCTSLVEVNFSDLVNLELIGLGNFNNSKIQIVDLSKSEKLKSIGVANATEPSSFSNMVDLEKVMLPTTYTTQVSASLFTKPNDSGEQIPFAGIGYYDKEGILSVPNNVINSSSTGTNLMYDRMSTVNLSQMKNLINVVPKTFSNNKQLTNVTFPSRALKWQIENNAYNTSSFANNDTLQTITFTNFTMDGGTGALIEPGSGWDQISDATNGTKIKNQLTNILNIFASSDTVTNIKNIPQWSYTNEGTTNIWNKDWYTDDTFGTPVTGNGQGTLGKNVTIAYKKLNNVVWKYEYDENTGAIKFSSQNVNLYKAIDSKNNANNYQVPFAVENNTNKNISVEINLVLPKVA